MCKIKEPQKENKDIEHNEYIRKFWQLVKKDVTIIKRFNFNVKLQLAR